MKELAEALTKFLEEHQQLRDRVQSLESKVFPCPEGYINVNGECIMLEPVFLITDADVGEKPLIKGKRTPMTLRCSQVELLSNNDIIERDGFKIQITGLHGQRYGIEFSCYGTLVTDDPNEYVPKKILYKEWRKWTS